MKKTEYLLPHAERYLFDFTKCTYAKGWAQIDTEQDASYYGNWINPTERAVTIFAEGDVSEIVFDDDAEMIAWMQRFKDNEGLGFKGIDPGLGSVMPSVLIAHGLGPFLH